ncbi:hypothetical protein SAMN03159444_00919 [Pseudomonas sp. NFACC02]|jgi:hypothetical protein|uniref:hypothetical protein n=1 Tax=Pseudomonas TaxID=286 RepID=UPI0007814265|nr:MULTISPECIES: hypothetical protein [Pseudomonas]SEQ00521.1 hypothetical protein SAMN03159444_00919 [Pseudomonas sp. NFACC02]
MKHNNISVVIGFAIFLAGCNGTSPSLFGGASTNSNCYDSQYAKSHIIVGKTSSADVISMCGDTKYKSVSSDGSEAWTYRESDQNSGYDPINSMLVKGFDRVQSAMGSSSVASQVGSEFSKANDGNPNSVTAANALTGKSNKRLGYSNFYFKNGVVSSYSISRN